MCPIEHVISAVGHKGLRHPSIPGLGRTKRSLTVQSSFGRHSLWLGDAVKLYLLLNWNPVSMIWQIKPWRSFNSSSALQWPTAVMLGGIGFTSKLLKPVHRLQQLPKCTPSEAGLSSWDWGVQDCINFENASFIPHGGFAQWLLFHTLGLVISAAATSLHDNATDPLAEECRLFTHKALQRILWF